MFFPYADDIVNMLDTSEKLQVLLNTLDSWCKKWHMNVNVNIPKSKIVQFHRKSVPITKVSMIDNNTLEVVKQYQYPGIYVNEFPDYNESTMLLCKEYGF